MQSLLFLCDDNVKYRFSVMGRNSHIWKIYKTVKYVDPPGWWDCVDGGSTAV